MKIEYKNHCYVLLRTEEIHPITEIRHDLIWYPESGLSFINVIKYIPYINSVVTENPWIISCYSVDKVFMLGDDGKWKHPRQQTYGLSVDMAIHSIIGINQSIPSTPLDGGEYINKFILKYEEKVRKAIIRN